MHTTKSHHYPLDPIVHPEAARFLDDEHQVHELLAGLGSPLHIVLPDRVVTNFARFTNIARAHKVPTTICYAHKANKSPSIVHELANNTTTQTGWIDVASMQELQRALAAGFTGNRIEATGPKNNAFIRLCLQHGTLLNCNSMDELRSIVGLHASLGLRAPARVFVRIKEFSSQEFEHTGGSQLQKDAKFGLNTSDIPELFAFLLAHGNALAFWGFSFHLTTTSERERAIATEHCLRLTLKALKAGLNPQALNIGGGFSCNFLRSGEQWHAYIAALKQSLLDTAMPTMSWNNSGLGFWAEGGTLRGAARFSEFYQTHDYPKQFEALLASTVPEFGVVGQFLQENMLQLYIEPGRALLDQAGITLTTIASQNQSLTNETVLFLNMNRSHLNAIELEFMADPLVIRHPNQVHAPRKDAKNGVFLSGNLCLPHDFITRRKVFFTTQPNNNDALAFINTAGYYMDFTESETLQHPLATRAVIQNNNWRLDRLR